MDNTPTYLSYSQFTTYQTCPWQWHLTRVQHVDEDPAWWFAGGTALHTASEAIDHELAKEGM